METATTPIADPVGFVRTLDADAIAARLAEIEAEASALRVLLRSARARERARRDRGGMPGTGGAAPTSTTTPTTPTPPDGPTPGGSGAAKAPRRRF
jgi:hypothetical protein